MIEALELANENVKRLPRERQEYAARMLEQIAEAATDEEARAVFDKYRA